MNISTSLNTSKITTILSVGLLTFGLSLSTAFAQSPEKMSYQAVVRNSSDALVSNQAIGMQISILQGSITGTAVYTETQTPTTNDNGSLSIEIGSGTVVSGAFNTINWANGPYFIKTEIDPTGGTTYTITGTNQLMSVPYALHAKTATSITGTITETDPVFGASIANGITAVDTANWNNHTIDTDTQLDSTDIANLGYVAGSGNGGKTYIVLAGGITDAQAVTKIANEYGSNTQFILVQNTTNLTTVNFSGITDLVDLSVQNNASLTNISLPNLTTIIDFTTSNNAALTNISLSTLTSIHGVFQIGNNTALTNFSLPALTTVGNNLSIYNNTGLTSTSFPALTTVESLSINGCAALTNIGLPALTTVGNNLNINNNTGLISTSLPALTTVESLSISGPTFSSVSLPALTTVSNSFLMGSSALSSATINTLLAQLVSISPTGIGIDFEFQNPPAPPTGQGVINKTTLINAGNFVATD